MSSASKTKMNFEEEHKKMSSANQKDTPISQNTSQGTSQNPQRSPSQDNSAFMEQVRKYLNENEEFLLTYLQEKIESNVVFGFKVRKLIRKYNESEAQQINQTTKEEKKISVPPTTETDATKEKSKTENKTKNEEKIQEPSVLNEEKIQKLVQEQVEKALRKINEKIQAIEDTHAKQKLVDQLGSKIHVTEDKLDKKINEVKSQTSEISDKQSKQEKQIKDLPSKDHVKEEIEKKCKSISDEVKVLNEKLNTEVKKLESSVSNNHAIALKRIEFGDKKYNQKFVELEFQLKEAQKKEDTLFLNGSFLFENLYKLTSVSTQMGHTLQRLAIPYKIKVTFFFDFIPQSAFLDPLLSNASRNKYYDFESISKKSSSINFSQNELVFFFFICPTDRWQDELPKDTFNQLKKEFKKVVIINCTLSNDINKVGKIGDAFDCECFQITINSKSALVNPEVNQQKFFDFLEDITPGVKAMKQNEGTFLPTLESLEDNLKQNKAN